MALAASHQLRVRLFALHVAGLALGLGKLVEGGESRLHVTAGGRLLVQ
jgi:hypothetical protein